MSKRKHSESDSESDSESYRSDSESFADCLPPYYGDFEQGKLSEPWVGCTFSEHTQWTKEEHNDRGHGDDKPWKWTVNFPAGNVDELKSCYVSRHPKTLWPQEKFKFDSQSSKEKALRLAEKHQHDENIRFKVGKNVWRYVRPDHVEIRTPEVFNPHGVFSIHGVKKCIVDFSWWQANKNKYIVLHDRVSGIRLTPVNDGNNRCSLTQNVIGAFKGSITRRVDNRPYHNCLANLRMNDNQSNKKLTPALDGKFYVFISQEEDQPESHWHIRAYKFHLIRGDADPTKVPESVVHTPHSEVTVVRRNGYLYWKAVYRFCKTTPVPVYLQWLCDDDILQDWRLAMTTIRRRMGNI